MENVTTVLALTVLWPFLSWIKRIFKWVVFSSCLLSGKIKAFRFGTLRLCGPSDDSESNEISTVFRGRGIFFAGFKELISITSVCYGSDKGGGFRFNTAAFHQL